MRGAAIRHADEVAGLLRIEAAAAQRFTAEQFQALELLAGVVGVRLSTGTVTPAAVSRDPLTGLPSRRGFAERLGAEAARARRYHQPLALCIFRGHRLAAVNERGGRVAGDEVLRRVARVSNGARTADESFRLGGDQRPSACASPSAAVRRRASHAVAARRARAWSRRSAAAAPRASSRPLTFTAGSGIAVLESPTPPRDTG